ncbi:MAG TPA: winged helix-turn-helix domain-containing protein [Sphingomicrobium sp.]
MNWLPEMLAGGRMYEPTQDALWVHSIDLAREADFNLGALRVRPARCEVEWNGDTRILQRRVMQVLVALSRSPGSVVSQSDLVVRCWRGLSVSDDAIYRCISKLRKLAANYPEPPFAIEAIPGIGYRLTSGHNEVGPVAPRRARFRLPALVAVVALLVFVGGALWVFQSRAPDRYPLRVAVEPFEALSDTAEAHSLAKRIPNEVVDALGDSQIETVLSGERASKDAGNPATPGLIVTGILRDDGRNSIVEVRIENGANGAALWSTEFKRATREASDLPLEVAARVADIVNMTSFARGAKPPLTDDSALTALLRTTEMLRDTTDDAWAPMVENAQSVVARHPDFAFGHSVLAAAYAEAAMMIDVPERARVMREAARKEADLTLKLDPEDAGAYAILSGLVGMANPYNYRGIEDVLLRGIERARHPREPLGALYSYEGTLLSNVGRLREALPLQLTAQATDKWGPPKTVKVALAYSNMGNLPAARTWIQQAVQRWPNHSSVRAYRLYIACFYEQPAVALAIIDAAGAQAPADRGEIPVWRSFVEAKAARSAQAIASTVPKIREAADQGRIPRETEIMMLAALGESKQAMDVANGALDRDQRLEPKFLFTPVTRNLRQDPGFVRLASRLGLIAYWRETGKRPDFCTDPPDSGECSPELLAGLRAH